MQANKKVIIKNSIFLYIRMGIVMVISLFTVRILLQALNVVDYGIYNAIGGVVASMSVITGVLLSASQRYFSYDLASNPDNLHNTFSAMMIIYLFLSIILVVVAETVGMWFVLNKMIIPSERLNAAIWVFHFSLICFIISLMQTIYNAVIVAYEDMNIYAYMSIIDVVFKLLIVYSLWISSFDKLVFYSFLMMCLCVLEFCAYCFICKKRYKNSVHFSFIWDKNIFKSIFKYSSWTLFGSMACMLNTQGVNIILNTFYGPIVNTAYAIANQVSSKVNELATGFYMAVRPAMIKTYADTDYEQSIMLLNYSSKIMFVFMFVLFLPLYLTCESVLVLWLGQIEEYMVSFTKLMLIYQFILSFNCPLTTIAQASGKVNRYHGIVDSFSLISLPIIYFLFRQGLAAEFSFGVIISVMTIAHMIRLFIIKNLLPGFSISSYFSSIIIPSAFVGVTSVALELFIQSQLDCNPYIEIIILSCCSLIIVLILSYLFLFNKEEKHKVRIVLYNKVLHRNI